jgi:hypothetical protein
MSCRWHSFYENGRLRIYLSHESLEDLENSLCQGFFVAYGTSPNGGPSDCIWYVPNTIMQQEGIFAYENPRIYQQDYRNG